MAAHFRQKDDGGAITAENGGGEKTTGDRDHKVLDNTVVNPQDGLGGGASSGSGSGGESGGEEMPAAVDSYAEVLLPPVNPPVVPVFSKQTKRRASKTFRGARQFLRLLLLIHIALSMNVLIHL